MVELGAAIAAVRAAYDTARTARDVNDKAVLNAAVSDIMERLTSAQFALTELLQEHHQIIDENRRLKEAQSREARFERYELEQTEMGAIVLRLKPTEMQPGEPSHAICPDCREQGLVSYLVETEYTFACQRCKYVARKKPKPPRRINRSRVVPPGHL